MSDKIVPADYLQIYDEHWKRLVEFPDGTLNKDQVARELSDCSMYMNHLAEIYDYVTHGRVSKPNTQPAAVIQIIEELESE